MTALDYWVLTLYFAVVMFVGSISGKGARSGVSYFLADRSIHWIPVAITMTAVSISTITFIGMPGQAFKSDWSFLQVYLVIPAAAFIVCRLFLPRYTATKVDTAYEYLERRFDLRTRLFASAVFLLILCGSTGVAIYAPAIMLAEMTGFSVVACVLILGVITTTYTVAGGVKGVIYTDIIQAFVFLAGWVFVTSFILQHLPGGVSTAWRIAMEHHKLRTFDFSFDAGSPVTLWAGLLGMLFVHVALGGVNQAQVQKYLTVSSMSGGQKAILFQGAGLLLIYVAFFALGTLLFVFYTTRPGRLPAGIAPDRVLPLFIMRELPPGLRGFLIAGAFAAAMSTISSALNSLSNVAVVDFLERMRPGKAVARGRWLTLLWGVTVMGAGILAWKIGSVLELIVKVNSYFYGSLLGVFLLGMLTRRGNGRGASIGLVSSMALIVALSVLQPNLWLWFGAIGCLVSLLVGYLMSPAGLEVGP